MFTGIVVGQGEVCEVVRQPGLLSCAIRLPGLPAETRPGDSIAINGACLTVTRVSGESAWFDLMRETLSVTTLDALRPGLHVNWEPAARFNDRIGGHMVAGHIHTTAALVARNESENNLELEFEVESKWHRYLFTKGYIAVDGASLTLNRITDRGFTVNLIPDTLRLTIFSTLATGDRVNIEFDPQTQAIVDTVERLLPEWLARQKH